MKLFKHQEQILSLLTQCDKFMVLAEQGTGKTFPMLLHITNLLMSGEAKTWLVIAPLSALGAWERDLALLSPSRRRLGKQITFINYDKISRNKSKWQMMIADNQWDGITLDEGHAITGNFIGKMSNRAKFLIGTKAIAGVSTHVKYKYLMTGTLWSNGRLEGIWCAMKFLCGNDEVVGLPESQGGRWYTKQEFKVRYLKTRSLPNTFVELVTGYKRKDELLSILSSYSIRVLKKDCLDLPEKMPDEVVKVPLSASKQYNEMLKDGVLDEYDLIADNPLTHRLRLRQIASGFVGDTETKVVYDLKSDKVKYLAELVESTLPHKVVIYYEFKHSCELICKMLDKAKIKYVTLNGDQKDKQIWRKFQEDDSIEVFVGQYQSANSGIDLFASTHTIYFEPTQSSIILEQSRDRTHRQGVRSACNYTFLLTEGTIEEEIYGCLAVYRDFDDKCYSEMMQRRLGKVFQNE